MDEADLAYPGSTQLGELALDQQTGSMTGPQAAIGRAQLEKLDFYVAIDFFLKRAPVRPQRRQQIKVGAVQHILDLHEFQPYLPVKENLLEPQQGPIIVIAVAIRGLVRRLG